MADVSQNKPVKEIIFALVGAGAFLAIVLFIGISGWLRPAGQHFTPEPEVEATTSEAADNKAEPNEGDTNNIAVAEAIDSAEAIVADTTIDETKDLHEDKLGDDATATAQSPSEKVESENTDSENITVTDEVNTEKANLEPQSDNKQ